MDGEFHFPFSIFDFSLVIEGAALLQWQMKNGKWKMENGKWPRPPAARFCYNECIDTP